MTQTVYLVIEDDIDGGYQVHRAYSERAEAEAFVEAYNATRSGYYEVEEVTLGAPDVAYDGPIWIGKWRIRRKINGEKQVIIVSDGFTTVVPSTVPVGGYRYQEYFTGPNWRDLATPVEYEEPPVWIDIFDYRQEWHTGNNPGPAAIDEHCDCTRVRGTSKEAVETLLRATALQVKTERGIR